MKGCLINPLSRAVQEGKKAAADNNVMRAKPDLRVFLKWMIAGSGSVITDDYEVLGRASVNFQ